MIVPAQQWFRRIRVAALCVAVELLVLLPSGLQAQMVDEPVDRRGPVFDTQSGGPILEHESIAEPENLDGTVAEHLYRSILPQMQAGYAASGDPLAWAYTNWRRFNAVPYNSRRHGGVFVNNYANAIAADAYGRLDAGAQMPVGAQIVKDSFVVTRRGEISAGMLSIMEKMPAGYDPANGDWRYLAIAPNGALVGITGNEAYDPRMSHCAACHNTAPVAQDRLFDVPKAVRR